MCPCVCAFAIFFFFFFRVVCFTDQDVATLIDVMRLCVQRIFADAAVMSLCTGIDDVVMCVGVRVLMLRRVSVCVNRC